MSNALRKLVVPAAIALGGWALGGTLAASPVEAASNESAGWSCETTDKCHAGTQRCCNDVSFSHCSTMCTILVQ
jgi:hypothetical protein